MTKTTWLIIYHRSYLYNITTIYHDAILMIHHLTTLIYVHQSMITLSEEHLQYIEDMTGETGFCYDGMTLTSRLFHDLLYKP